MSGRRALASTVRRGLVRALTGAIGRRVSALTGAVGRRVSARGGQSQTGRVSAMHGRR